jgi:hypothetical protein
MLSSDSPMIMPAKKAPSAKETPNSFGRAEGDAQRDREHGEAEQFARAEYGRRRCSIHGIRPCGRPPA